MSFDKLLLDLPLLPAYLEKDNGALLWLAQLEKKFFFKNQKELFRCHLLTLNKKVLIAYDGSFILSVQYAKFVRANLPKNPKDRKHVFFDYVQQ